MQHLKKKKWNIIKAIKVCLIFFSQKNAYTVQRRDFIQSIWFTPKQNENKQITREGKKDWKSNEL